MSKDIITGSFNNIMIIAIVILFIMLILFAYFLILYFKSKNTKKEEHANILEPIKSQHTKAKNYSIESIFDFMEFDKIMDNMILIKDGTQYVMVVECQGINYDLMSEAEKNGVEDGFIQFLNTLRYPIQIYTQTRTINLNNSIQAYRTKMNEIENNLERERKKYEAKLKSGKYTEEQLNVALYELTKATNLYEYGKDIVYNTEKMSLNKNILSQKYYIIISYYPEELGETNFDKQEIKNLAFSELYTRAQSVIRTISVCGVNGKILNSMELIDLLYIAYNRDDAENYSVDKAIESGYNELYSTAPDVIEKKIKVLDEQITREALKKANQKVFDAKTDKQKQLEKMEKNKDDLVSQLAQLIIEQNKVNVGEDVAKSAISKIKEEAKNRRENLNKNQSIEEGGTNKNEQKKQTKRTRVTKSAK